VGKEYSTPFLAFGSPGEYSVPRLCHSDAKRKNLCAGSMLHMAALVINPFRLSHNQRFFTSAERTPPGSE
jgi:hypothetical protein